MLDANVHKQTIVCWQLFVGHVVRSGPMRSKEKMNRMLTSFILSSVVFLTSYKENPPSEYNLNITNYRCFSAQEFHIPRTSASAIYLGKLFSSGNIKYK